MELGTNDPAPSRSDDVQIVAGSAPSFKIINEERRQANALLDSLIEDGRAAEQEHKAGPGDPAFELRISSEVFDKFEEWECEEADKQHLRTL